MATMVNAMAEFCQLTDWCDCRWSFVFLLSCNRYTVVAVRCDIRVLLSCNPSADGLANLIMNEELIPNFQFLISNSQLSHPFHGHRKTDYVHVSPIRNVDKQRPYNDSIV